MPADLTPPLEYRTERPAFWRRLSDAVAARGPLCVGIDPHPQLLRQWGLDDDPAGLERFALDAVEALAPQVALVKPQSAFFERHGSRGVAVPERVLTQARDAGALVLLDVKRGDIGSTMAGYSEAYLAEGAPLSSDAITLSPYLGVDALNELNGPILAPGIGVQGAALTDLPRIFGAAAHHVLPTISRDLLRYGPELLALRSVARRRADEAAALLIPRSRQADGGTPR